MARDNSLVFNFLARDQASKTFDKLAGKSGKLSGALGKFAKRAAKAATAAGVAFAGVGVKGFLEFDDAMTQSLAIMGDIAGPMRDKMEKAARAVGKTTRFSATQAAESYFFLASAGMDAGQAVAAMPQVAKFAQAGMFDLARATDLATDAQSALGLTVKDPTKNLENLTKVTDVLVGANTLANATVEQFSEALTNKAGPALRAVNKPIEEGVAVLAAFADQGIKGNLAGNQLAIVMRDLQTQALKNEDAFKKAGIAVFDSSGNMNNLGDIVGMLENRLDGMSDAQKRAELSQLGFTDRSVQAIMALLGTSEAIKGYEADLRSMGGVTEDVAGKQLESFRAKLDIIRSHIMDVAMTVGEHLVNAVFTVGEKLAPLGSRIASILSTEVKPRVQRAWQDIEDILFGARAMETSEEEMSGARIGTGLVGGIVDEVKKQADRINTEFAPLGRAILKSAADAITTRIQILVTAFTKGVETGDFSGLGEAIGKMVSESVLRVVDWAGIFFSWIASVNWATVGIAAGKLLIPFAVGLIAGVIDGLFDPKVWAQIAENWQVILMAAVAVAFAPARLIGAIGKLLSKIPLVGRMLKWFFDAFAKVARAVIPGVAKFLGRIFMAFINGLTRGGAGRVLNKVREWLALIPTAIGVAAINVARAARDMIQRMIGAILGFAGRVGETMGRVGGWLTAPFRKAGGWLVDRGKQLIGGLKSGISAVGRGLRGFMNTGPVTAIRGAFTKAGGWLTERGKQLIGGLKTGITAVTRGLRSFFNKETYRRIVDFHHRAGDWLTNAGRRVVRGLFDGVASVARTISTFFRERVRQPVISFFSRANEWLVNAGKNLLRGLKNGMLDLVKNPVGFFKSVGDKIVSGVKSFFGIKSPSKMFAGFGKNLVQGMIKGMITTGGGLRSTVGKVFGGMPQALNHLVQRGVIAVSALPNKALDALEGLGNAARGVWNMIFGEDPGAGNSSSRGQFQFPLPRGSYRVGQGLGAGRGHTGQDFPAATGTPVYAPFTGRLSNVNLGNRSYGMYANVAAGAWRFIGAHLSRFARGPGLVRAGEIIGYVGSTGRSTGPHLHAEFRNSGKVVDPRQVMGFAKGGFPKAGNWNWVGENGPELVRFNRPGAKVFSRRESQEMTDPNNGHGHHDCGHDRPIHVDQVVVQAWNERFSLAQVEKDLRFRGLI